MLAAIALDVLPAQRHQGHLGVATAGFALGTAVLLGLRQLEARTAPQRALGGRRGFPSGCSSR